MEHIYAIAGLLLASLSLVQAQMPIFKKIEIQRALPSEGRGQIWNGTYKNNGLRDSLLIEARKGVVE